MSAPNLSTPETVSDHAALSHNAPRPADLALSPTGTLLAVPPDRHSELPLSDDLAFVREALTSLVRGGRYLLSGSPGGYKSRLTTQIGLDLARQGVPSLFILTEEGAPRLRDRVQQMTADWPAGVAEEALKHIRVEPAIHDVAMLPSYFLRHVINPTGQHHGVKLIVTDSLHGHGLPAAATRSYEKLYEFARLCEEHSITLILVAHVNKAGDISGPRTLEHNVDVSLVTRRAMQYTLLSVRKNRFGPPVLRPIPLRVDPLTSRLGPVPHCDASPSMARTYSGAGLVEIQASVAMPADGAKGRITAPGLPRKEIEQLAGCIAQIRDLELGDLHYIIHCRLPGSGRYQPTFGLPLCLALIGTCLRRPIPTDVLSIGEIDLFRKVRAVPPTLIEGLRNSIAAGEMLLPMRLLGPPAVEQLLDPVPAGLTFVPCRTLEDALVQIWPDLR